MKSKIKKLLFTLPAIVLCGCLGFVQKQLPYNKRQVHNVQKCALAAGGVIILQNAA